MPNDSVPPVVQLWHELLAWMITLLDQLSRARRVTLDERLESWGMR